MRESGELACWGLDSFGQTNAPDGRFVAVSAGLQHTCGIRESGELACWGHNWFSETNAPGGRFSAISAGSQYTCDIRESGEIACWGFNSDGQTDAPGGRFRAVGSGLWHTCGVRESGELECWGDNDSGKTDAPIGRFRNVSAGEGQSCGLREAGWAGWLVCWGERDFGQTDAANAAAQINLDRGQIAARRLADGRTEFAWQPAIGERALPRRRYVPADAQVDRWLRSSPIELSGVELGRIEARLRADGRIESAFAPTGSERILPPSRYTPAAAPPGRWLRSSEIDPTPPPPPR